MGEIIKINQVKQVATLNLIFRDPSYSVEEAQDKLNKLLSSEKWEFLSFGIQKCTPSIQNGFIVCVIQIEVNNNNSLDSIFNESPIEWSFLKIGNFSLKPSEISNKELEQIKQII